MSIFSSKTSENELPAHLEKIDLMTTSLKFGMIGIYNTRRDNSFYKVIATIG